MAKFVTFLLTLTSATLLISANPIEDASLLIVGGEEANIGEFPWMVDLRWDWNGSGNDLHTCGASIVNPYWVLTAAHCTESLASEYILVAGDHDISVIEGTEQTRRAELIVNYPNYTGRAPLEHDISLVKVSEPFNLNMRVQPVALASTGFVPTNITTPCGWGTTTEGGAPSDVLMKVDVPYVDDETCREAYDGRTLETMMCAGVMDVGGKDSCQMDSGGPLMCDTGCTKFLCGIVSWGDGCGRPESPGIYTEVSHYAQWIQTVISNS